MILQALKGYYEREKDNLPPFGYQEGKIHFELVLNREGKLVTVNDIRPMIETGKKKKVMKRAPSRLMSVSSLLKSVTTAGTPRFAWGNTRYVLGSGGNHALKCFESFKTMHHQLGDELELPLMQALLTFLDNWIPAQTVEVINAHTTGDLDWDEVSGKNLVIRLDGEHLWLHDSPKVLKIWQKHLDIYYREPVDEKTVPESLPGFCLVSGKEDRIVRLHLPIHGVKKVLPTGGSISSFKKDATKSYGKQYNFNAPVGIDAAFEYATALNSLLSNYDHRVQVGDATTVFWTEEPSEAEGIFAATLGGVEEEDLKVNEYLTAVSTGHQPKNLRLDVPFYVLGLSPNSARISVRFWYASTVGEIGERLGQHFEDLRIERWDNELKKMTDRPNYPSLGMWQLVLQTAPLENDRRKAEKIPPTLAGEFMRSILTGGRYPQSLLAAIINRIRSEAAKTGKKSPVSYLQASLIKGCLVRNYKQLEVTMSLDNDNNSTAYLIGRLFAICEGAQKAALGNKINRTIKDGYISSASATPRSVFPRLLSLVQHHIKKAEYGGRYDKLIGKVMDRIGEFPAHLKLEDQGVFFLGYYHQRNDFFKKYNKEDKN